MSKIVDKIELEIMKNNQMKEILKCALLNAKKDHKEIDIELKNAIEKDDLMDSIKTTCIENISHILYGVWIFEYKSVYYLLGDSSNGHFSYISPVEEFIDKNNFSHQYVI